jgi:CO/xanthine dehydrogenase FAD-binding subunit
MERFYRWSGETVLQAGEVMLAIEVPRIDAAQVYEKYAQWRGDFPEASAAVRLRRSGGRLSEVRISLGGVAPLPMRPKAAEAALLRDGIGDAALRRAAEQVVRGALPLKDNAAKLDMIVAVTERALRRARDRQ